MAQGVDRSSLGREDYMDMEEAENGTVVHGGCLVGTLIVVDNGRTPSLPWVKSSDSIM
jgi:hypothetical protein